VVVCDIVMPERDGYAFIRALRRLPPERGGGVPALAVTAYASAEDRRKAAEAGFDAHLAKPIDPETFVELVTRLPRRRGESAAGAENPS